MKKFMMFAVIAIAGLMFMPEVHASELPTADGAAVEVTGELIEGTKYYSTLNEVTTSYPTNKTIKLLKNINEGEITVKRNNITIDLNGFTITSATDKTINAENVRLTITDTSADKDGKIVNTAGGNVIYIDGNTVTLEAGTLEQQNAEGNGLAAVSLASRASIASNFVMNGGKIVANIGIAFYSGGKYVEPSVTINAGEIQAKAFAISGNANNEFSTSISINGGIVASSNSVAIYQPQKGSVEVTNGLIAGKVGILARQGDVTISGGTIQASGSEDEEIRAGDLSKSLPAGVAVIVDNTEDSYPEDANVSITGGNFITTNTPVLSVDEDAEDITVSGGYFSKTVDGIYIADGLVQDENGNIAKPVAAVLPAEKDETNPDTADINLYALLGLILASGCGLAVVAKKRFN